MKITVKGEMTLAEMRQALFEALNNIENDYSLKYSRGATLYLNPTDGVGHEVTPRKPTGEEVREIQSRGPYRSAADHYKI